MLDAKDIEILRGMFSENNQILKREIRDEMHALLKASGAGLIRRMDVMEEGLIRRMNMMKDEVIDGTLDILNDDVLPRVHVLERDMITVKQELKLV